jgi:hypothetical protein
VGSAASTGGIGLKGRAYATSGATTGILATINSPSGTGLVINNVAGGKLFSGQNNGVEKINFDASGNVTTSGTFTGNGSGLTNVAALTAATATNSLALGGVAPSGYATTSTNTFTATQTVGSGDVSLTAGDLDLPATNSAGTAGVITLNGAPFSHAFGSQNTFLGGYAGNFTLTGDLNTGIGWDSLSVDTSGFGNTAVGWMALSSNTSGADNTAVGLGALQHNATGGSNTAVGSDALNSNTSGGSNTAVGPSALQHNTTGGSNTAAGAGALSANTSGRVNVGIGANALSANDTAYNNTAVGNCALMQTYGTTAIPGSCSPPTPGSGAGNSALGYAAGQANTTGQDDTFVGTEANASTGTLTNATAVGAYAAVAESNALVLGSINGVNGATSSVKVGIGTSAPAHTLDVVGDINATANIATSGKFSGDGSLLTNVTASTATTASGLSCTGCVGNTQLGVNYAASDSKGGDAANALLLDGYAYTAFQPAGSYATLGANAFAGDQSVSGTVGVVASASGATAMSVQATELTASNTAVSAIADGVDGTGVVGQAMNGSNATGVWGISSSGEAGLFEGNVSVTGTLSAAAKSFKIDDPLDPADKFLVHASVESSELKTVYDGMVTLDANGAAVVQLPDWFEALNGDFRYQLTCVGGYAPVYIAQKIRNNIFKIGGGTPGLEVDWQVTGVRHDPYAEAHPLRVERQKTAKERGYYLHPELYGQPGKKSIEWADHPGIMARLSKSKGNH